MQSVEEQKTSRVPPKGSGLGAVGLLTVAALFWFMPRGDTVAPKDAGRPTLAVLPFDNLGDPEDEYSADGLTEEMTTRLAQISGRQVTARTSTRRYKDTTGDIREIGAELGVQSILEGTIRTIDEFFEELNKMITERTLNPPRLFTFHSLRNDARWGLTLARMGLEP